MGYENRYQGIDDYAVQLIKYKARQLVGRVGFTESDREDLEQEMVLDLLRRLPKFDPKRAGRNTFIARIVEHKVATIIEAQKAGMRDYRLCSCSLNDRLEDEEGRSIERMETIDQEDYLRRTGKLSRPMSELRHLSIDLRSAVQTLPPELRELCKRLQTESVTEISRDTGIPRGTIYESIKKLRAIFEDAGLKDYL
ncbi:sigma-70 family RNA polymerase sigma factor [Pseudodesulfovibrio thermohalotolerans]|jgi:RNA polymerase sigma-70 factor (ECF subfamily)|uniref:sigma-70 family RNA polymerase sigma factor n=1 Tax=Pseudodesulfovibrio thermohalotolerans TaxID=2880651 RepID=UPI0022B9FC4F|nr:sigma-70 family RNA polymerase sigma factor [Pseudodesulfovibrio thermohalotolerans]WFS60866.1 sigma-70 family RNA polymerase sigma factor [Pseudodesulfovibrio thermohalotolerans]